jgi:hypothetical protein
MMNGDTGDPAVVLLYFYANCYILSSNKYSLLINLWINIILMDSFQSKNWTMTLLSSVSQKYQLGYAEYLFQLSNFIIIICRTT